MNNPVDNSHFISRWLTKRWELPGGRLRYYDFATGTFGSRSSRRLFTLRDPVGDPLEKFFNSYLESPLSNYIANVCFGRAREPNWKEERALRLTVFLQKARTNFDDVSAEYRASFETMAQQEEALIDSLAAIVGQGFRFFSGWLPTGQFLYYPSTGVVPLPTVRGEGGFLPVTPFSYAAFVPNGTTDDEIRILMVAEGCLTALSVGDEASTKVVVPAMLCGQVDDDVVRRQICEFRDLGPRLCMQISKFGEAAFGETARGSVSRRISERLAAMGRRR